MYKTIVLRLASWRAGRYQIADYAQNIRNFSVQKSNGEPVPFSKKSKNTWIFTNTAEAEYTVRYQYYAAKMDAGSTWIDDQQIYINFVNCLFEVLGTSSEDVSVVLNQNGYSKRVCTLSSKGPETYVAPNFQTLADSTLLAANDLTHWTYETYSQEFHIWIHGEVHFSKTKFIQAHQAFTRRLIQDFGSFPTDEYHFIYQLLPYKHYHGVEHKKGTVITFGPAEKLKEPDAMEDLIGVACHELYHAWNVCQIRPKELLPYNFGSEVYTEAGWMLEGITTYMGDLYLLKSGVYDIETYLKHFNKVIARESMIQGFQQSSILESSFDLWLDGYQAGIPDKKTSIYTHGALIVFALDLMLLESGDSFTNSMARVWRVFKNKKSGYGARSFWILLRSDEELGHLFDEFYSQFIYGRGNIFNFLEEKVHLIGMELASFKNTNALLAETGIMAKDGVIQKIHPESSAYFELMVGDKIEASESENSFEVQATRINGKTYSFKYAKGQANYYPQRELRLASKTAQFETWSK